MMEGKCLRTKVLWWHSGYVTRGLIYVPLRAQRNQRLCQTAYSARCVSAFYVVFIKPEPRGVISVISAPLKEGRMGGIHTHTHTTTQKKEQNVSTPTTQYNTV